MGPWTWLTPRNKARQMPPSLAAATLEDGGTPPPGQGMSEDGAVDDRLEQRQAWVPGHSRSSALGLGNSDDWMSSTVDSRNVCFLILIKIFAKWFLTRRLK